jgi:pyruvate/2-oxoglutarate dehydrogenase complex dihydrolipoamide dehydrogenase (E3) component
MIASGRVAYLTRRGPDYGVHTGPIQIDMERIRQRKRKLVQMFRDGSERGVQQLEDLDLYRGTARFTAARTVEVTPAEGQARTLTADRVLINTGQRPRIPDLPGLGEVGYHDSTSIMELGELPEHLLVLGGGYIGLEFGQLFARLGSKVTILQRREQVLPGEDTDIAQCLQQILGEDGIDLWLSSDVQQVQHNGQQIELTVTGPQGRDRLAGSHLLVATGRRPNTDGLNLDAAGVEVDERGYVPVDDHLRTSAEGVYASGDVHGGPAFTHTSYEDFRVLKANLLRGEDRTTDHRIVANTVFTDPQLGRVGLTEHEARQRGYDVAVASMPMTSVPRALETDETRGLMKAVVDRQTDRILGAAALGIEGGEVASMIQVAMEGDLPYTVLRDAPFAHPTLAESLNNLFGKLSSHKRAWLVGVRYPPRASRIGGAPAKHNTPSQVCGVTIRASKASLL